MTEKPRTFPLYYASVTSTDNHFDVMIILNEDSFRRYCVCKLPGGIFSSEVVTKTQEKFIVNAVICGKNYRYKRWRKIKLREFIHYMKRLSLHDLFTVRNIPLTSPN